MTQIKTGAAALAAIAVLAACGNDSEGGTGSDKAGEEPTPSAQQSDYSTIPDDSAPIEPGRWAVKAEGPSAAPLAVFDVPEGFYGGGPYIWTNMAVIGYWTVDVVYHDPCSDSGSAPPLGETIEDLAAALAAQELTSTTNAVPVSVGGHDGLYLELSTPADFDYSTCHEDGLHIWNGRPAIGERQTDRYWILDVDGQRVMIMVGTDATATAETAQLFSGIVKGATFVGAD